MASRMPLPRFLLSRPAVRSCSTATTSTTTRSATSPARVTLRQQNKYNNFNNSRFRAYSSEPPKTGNTSKVKFWPFLALIGVSSLGYMGLVNRRKDMPPSPQPPPGQIAAPAKSTPAFSPEDVTVLFVLGGPGAGKGTQCSRLVENHGFTHLSAGDLLRAEQQRPGSEFGDLIRDYIKNGLIVPMEVTVQLLENAMRDALDKSGGKKGKFLIDGFPRKMDQAHKFEEAVCPAKLVLFYDCPENVMESRLLERGKTSGRSDDNAESIRKRFRTFIETSMPVVDYYEKEGKVIKVDATASPDQVFNTTQKNLKSRLGDF
ncbi:adenylate kinase domain-containing protein [Sarocladium implicatum]|nr:adenylate kinase domain-containing protein [Sarocladium implicatum]